jgi:phospholipid/cholesterol/gamma-HCH transport system substrate-binding protein
MNEQSMRFRIGIFVMAALLLLAVLVILFGDVPTVFKGQDRYTIVFDHATGVAIGTPVRRSGVRIGQVQKVTLDDATGKVRVTITIDRPHVLYEGDQAELVHGALSGDTSIDFVAPTGPGSKETTTSLPQSEKNDAEIQQAAWNGGQAPERVPAPEPQPPPARTPVPPGTEFRGVSQADVSSLIKALSNLGQPAQEAFADLRKTLDMVQRDMPLAEETLRQYRDLAKASRELLPDVRRTNDEIQIASHNWAKLGERLDVLMQANEDKLVKTLDRLSDTVSRVSNILSEENQRNVNAILKNVSAGTKNLDSIAQNTDEFLKETRTMIKKINDSLLQTDQILADLRTTTRPFAERSESMARNLDETTDKLNRTLTDVRALLQNINQSEGSLQRFLTDPALYNNLNEAACMLTHTLPRVDRILGDVEVFADKIARHPESLGVRGAISPSSGIKDVPPTPSHWPYLPER